MTPKQHIKGPMWLSELSSVPGFRRSFPYLVVSSAVINILALAIPVTLMQVYDRIILNKAIPTLSWLLIGCIVAILLDTVIRIARSYVSAWAAARFEHLLSLKAIGNILQSSLESFTSVAVGTHIERLNSINTLRGYYAGQIFQVALDLPFAALYLIAIWYIAGTLFVVPVLVAAVFIGVVSLFKKRYERERFDNYEIDTHKYNSVIDMLSGIHTIKSLTIEEQMLRRYETVQDEITVSNMSLGMTESLFSTVSGLFSQLAMFAVIFAGGSLVIAGSLTIGGLTACVMLVGRFMQPVQQAGSFWLKLSDAKIASDHVDKIIGLTSEKTDTSRRFPDDIDGNLSLMNVTFRYGDTGTAIARDLSLDIRANSYVCIRGNGRSGTTTLLYLMLGILRPQSGSVSVDDYDISGSDYGDLSDLMEYLPDKGMLFKGTILDNITMFRPELNTEALDASTVLGLDGFVSELHLGYNTLVDINAVNTMPSMVVHLISIARALVKRPRILLLDKTSAAMDQDTKKAFDSVLDHLAGKCTIVHVVDARQRVENADAIYELADGTLRLVNQ